MNEKNEVKLNRRVQPGHWWAEAYGELTIVAVTCEEGDQTVWLIGNEMCYTLEHQGGKLIKWIEPPFTTKGEELRGVDAVPGEEVGVSKHVGPHPMVIQLRNQRLEVAYERARDLLREGEIDGGRIDPSPELIRLLNDALLRVAELDESPLVFYTGSPLTEPDFFKDLATREASRVAKAQVAMNVADLSVGKA